jgi:hypothetical protein
MFGKGKRSKFFFSKPKFLTAGDDNQKALAEFQKNFLEFQKQTEDKINELQDTIDAQAEANAAQAGEIQTLRSDLVAARQDQANLRNEVTTSFGDAAADLHSQVATAGTAQDAKFAALQSAVNALPATMDSKISTAKADVIAIARADSDSKVGSLRGESQASFQQAYNDINTKSAAAKAEAIASADAKISSLESSLNTKMSNVSTTVKALSTSNKVLTTETLPDIQARIADAHEKIARDAISLETIGITLQGDGTDANPGLVKVVNGEKGLVAQMADTQGSLGYLERQDITGSAATAAAIASAKNEMSSAMDNKIASVQAGLQANIDSKVSAAQAQQSFQDAFRDLQNTKAEITNLQNGDLKNNIVNLVKGIPVGTVPASQEQIDLYNKQLQKYDMIKSEPEKAFKLWGIDADKVKPPVAPQPTQIILGGVADYFIAVQQKSDQQMVSTIPGMIGDFVIGQETIDTPVYDMKGNQTGTVPTLTPVKIIDVYGRINGVRQELITANGSLTSLSSQVATLRNASVDPKSATTGLIIQAVLDTVVGPSAPTANAGNTRSIRDWMGALQTLNSDLANRVLDVPVVGGGSIRQYLDNTKKIFTLDGSLAFDPATFSPTAWFNVLGSKVLTPILNANIPGSNGTSLQKILDCAMNIVTVDGQVLMMNNWNSPPTFNWTATAWFDAMKPKILGALQGMITPLQGIITVDGTYTTTPFTPQGWMTAVGNKVMAPMKGAVDKLTGFTQNGLRNTAVALDVITNGILSRIVAAFVNVVGAASNIKTKTLWGYAGGLVSGNVNPLIFDTASWVSAKEYIMSLITNNTACPDIYTSLYWSPDDPTALATRQTMAKQGWLGILELVTKNLVLGKTYNPNLNVFVSSSPLVVAADTLDLLPKLFPGSAGWAVLPPSVPVSPGGSPFQVTNLPVTPPPAASAYKMPFGRNA